MNRDHLDLLNAWFSQEARGNTAFVLTDAGQFLPAADWGGFRRAACDRGRIVYLAEALEANDPRWRSASAWAWKVRRDRQADVESGVAYLDAPVPGVPVDADAPQVVRPLIDPTSSQPQPLQTTDWVIDQLMPEEAETVPLWTVGLILGVFVVITGPVDYYLLGRLRRRVWTWVTYPAWTILCTAFIVWIANYSMQMADVRRSLIIRDLAPDGRLLMENRIELLIAGRRRTAVHRMARELAVPMDRRALTRADYVASLSDVARPMPAVLAGQLPRNYVVSQELWQWTPELRRTLRLESERNRPGQVGAGRRASAHSQGPEEPMDEGGGTDPRPPAPTVDWRSLGKYAPNDPELLVQLQRQLGDNDLDVRTFSQKHGLTVLRQRAERQRAYLPAWPARTPYVRGGMPGPPSTFLAEISTRDVGIHKVVSRISPSGSPTLEDLPMADLSNPDEWMLCVLLREGTHLVLYRIVYPVPAAEDSAAGGAH